MAKNKALVGPITSASYAAVFRDLRGFFAKTWVWILLLWAEQIALYLVVPHLPPWMSSDNLTSLPSMLIFAGAAVAWHRKILVKEPTQGLRAVRLGAREWSYFAVAFLTWMGYLALSVIVRAFRGNYLPEWWAISLLVILFAYVYAVTRFGLVFPLLAIDESAPFSKSWRLLNRRVLRVFFIGLITTIPLSFVVDWIDELSAAAFDQGQNVVGYVILGASCAVSIMSACVVAGSLSFLLIRFRSPEADPSLQSQITA